MNRYVGIDQSYTGFAFVSLDADGTDVSGNLTSFDAKTGNGIGRLLSVYQHLLNLLSETDDVVHICMEGYSAASKFGREQAGELGAIVKLGIYDYFDRFADRLDDLRYPTIIQPTTLKKFVTGSGTAKKNNMLLAVYKKWGFETSDDNLADAYSLARVARAIHTGKTDLAYETDALKAVHPHTEMPPATIPST
jgi:crossover junction endodeoxyribonuclease RuvC